MFLKVIIKVVAFFLGHPVYDRLHGVSVDRYVLWLKNKQLDECMVTEQLPDRNNYMYTKIFMYFFCLFWQKHKLNF